MKTSYAEKCKFIQQGSAIAVELVKMQPKTIVDCGACDGLDSIIYAKLFPQATVYAIEARVDNFNEIIVNMRLFGCKNIIPINTCLSNKEGVSPFYHSYGESGNKKEWETGNKSSSIRKPTGHLAFHNWCRFQEATTPTVRFDKLNITHVDFLHLDVQGAELEVLGGFGLALGTLKAVWLEVAKVELYEGQPLATDIENFMRANNFSKISDTCHNRFGDQLWCR
jgi:FkbM family methyltransferase